jgi:hypothetical protein
MRSRSFQNALLIIVFGGIIAGLTFARQWLAPPAPPPPPSKSGDDPKKSLLIDFGGTTMAGLNYEMTPARGYQDLWFKNDKSEDLELGLVQTSCKCAGVEVTLISSQETETLRNWMPAAAGTLLGLGPAGLLAVMGPGQLTMSEMRSLNEETRWHALKREELEPAPFPLPGKSEGIIRMRWEGRKSGPERISATIWVQPVHQPSKRTYTNLELPMVFVRPLMIQPSQASLALRAGDKKTVSFWCWSSTRSGFSLTAQEESHNPCFSCVCVPLTGEEYEQALKTIKSTPPPSILSGYRIAVTVSERLENGPQMDLGHFNRKIVLQSSDLEFLPGTNEFNVSVQGYVQGEVSVGLERDKDQVNLGSYLVTRGTTKTVPVETLKSGLKLKKIDQTPPFLDVQLKEKGNSLEGTRYSMTVTVPPNRGYLPEDSVIVLETNDQPPRKVRIPVAGIATTPVRAGR